ncbi:MAG: hypothetical protein KAR01_03280, partial [Desulfocapsa sp.]|nr:hypothetical protein [Desulfocapsa sp.]
SELIGAVSRITNEQAASSVEVAKTMNEIGVISTEAARETRTSSTSMRDMAQVADEMLQAVAIFKLDDKDIKVAAVATDDDSLVSIEAEEINEKDAEAEDLAFLLSDES